MSERAARRALALAIGAVAATLALLTGFEGPRERPLPSQDGARLGGTPSPRRVEPAARPLPPPDPHGHHRERDPTERRAARAVARRFVGALLRYQSGAPPTSWRRRLEGTATRRLARELARRPPRPPDVGPPPRGRVQALEVYGPVRGRVRASAVLDYGDATPGLIDLELRRAGRRWRVVALYR